MSHTAKSAKPADVSKSSHSMTATKKRSLPGNAKNAAQTSTEPRDELPTNAGRVFSIGDTVSIPTKVHPAGKAVIVGVEWGPARGRKARDGWLLYLSLGSGPAWEATEGELVEWGNG